MKSSRILIFYLLICVLSVLCVKKIFVLHSEREEIAVSYLALLPEPVARIVAVEFHGLLSDYLMLNTLTFLGDKVLSERSVSSDEWNMVYHALKQAVNLDSMATDPFTLAETTLPWESDLIEETNQLLLRVAQVQTKNYRPYFFLWFNYYYFLQDYKRAGYYLQKSAIIPGAPSYFSTLTARMQLLAGQHTEAIIFLQEIIKETTDTSRKKYLLQRLNALKIMYFLEKNIQRYAQRYKKKPETLQDLVTQGIIKEIPKDPYNGKFYIMENGRVYTTSKLVNTSPK